MRCRDARAGRGCRVRRERADDEGLPSLRRSSFTAARWMKPSPRRSPRKTRPMPPSPSSRPRVQVPRVRPGAAGEAGSAASSTSGSTQERCWPSSREWALSPAASRSASSRGEFAVVRAPLANEGGARPIVRQLSRFVEENPEPLPTVSGALGQIRLPPGLDRISSTVRSPTRDSFFSPSPPRYDRASATRKKPTRCIHPSVSP